MFVPRTTHSSCPLASHSQPIPSGAQAESRVVRPWNGLPLTRPSTQDNRERLARGHHRTGRDSWDRSGRDRRAKTGGDRDDRPRQGRGGGHLNPRRPPPRLPPRRVGSNLPSRLLVRVGRDRSVPVQVADSKLLPDRRSSSTSADLSRRGRSQRGLIPMAQPRMDSWERISAPRMR